MGGQRHISPEVEVNLSWVLAEQVIRSGYKPDIVLSLYRGGGKPAPAVVEALREIAGWEFDDFPIKARRYDNSHNGGSNVIMWGISALPTPPIGRRVLLLDDIYDEGKTLRTAKEDIRAHYKPLDLELRVGVNIFKTGNDPEGERPDFYGMEIPGSVWVIQTYEQESRWADDLRDRLRHDGYSVKELPTPVGLAALRP